MRWRCGRRSVTGDDFGDPSGVLLVGERVDVIVESVAVLDAVELLVVDRAGVERVELLVLRWRWLLLLLLELLLLWCGLSEVRRGGEGRFVVANDTGDVFRMRVDLRHERWCFADDDRRWRLLARSSRADDKRWGGGGLRFANFLDNQRTWRGWRWWTN